jgi:hypothetical protein
MPAFLADPSPTLILLLAVAAMAAAAAWFSRRSKRIGLVALALFALLALLLLLGQGYESPREEAVRRVNAMCTAATAADANAFIEHVSNSFSVNGKKRDALRNSGAWALVRQHRVTVTASAFDRGNVTYSGDNELSLSFMAKAVAADGGQVWRWTTAKFVKDPDGGWRMAGVQFFDPINTKQADAVPGFP